MYQSTPVPEMKETVQSKNPHPIRDLDTEYIVLSQRRYANYTHTHTHTHSLSGTETIKSKIELSCTALTSLLMLLASQYSDPCMILFHIIVRLIYIKKKIAYSISDDMSFLICHLGYKQFPFSLFSFSLSLLLPLSPSFSSHSL